MAMQFFENVVDLRIQVPNARLGEMTIDRFEKCVAIQIGYARCDPVYNAIHQFPPPAFVIVIARSVCGRTHWRLFPGCGEGFVESGVIQAQTDSSAHVRIMMTDALR